MLSVGYSIANHGNTFSYPHKQEEKVLDFGFL